KGVELDALKKLPEPERKELIERAVAGEQVSARKPEPVAETFTPAAGEWLPDEQSDDGELSVAQFARMVQNLERDVIDECGASLDELIDFVQENVETLDGDVLDMIAQQEAVLYRLYHLTQTIREHRAGQ